MDLKPPAYALLAKYQTTPSPVTIVIANKISGTTTECEMGIYMTISAQMIDIIKKT